MYKFIFLEVIAIVIGSLAFLIVIVQIYKNQLVSDFFKSKKIKISVFLFVTMFFVWYFATKTYPPSFAMPVFMRSHAPGGLSASIPFGKIIEFFKYQNRFIKISDIGANPNDVPILPKKPDEDGVVRMSLTAQEVISEISPGIYFNYWTYNNQVPGPMLRIKEGDIVELTLTNHPSSLHAHNIDLHSVTGPGGGAVLTNVAPGDTKTFRWKALNPGLFIYHCARPNVSTHNSHGQYGLILVEPKEGLPKVDKEFYVVQGELYTIGQLGKKGLVPFDSQAMLDGVPNYVTFNGRIEDSSRMNAKVGDKIRMYVGNGGVNLISSFHIIGEIFDKVYPNGSIGEGATIEMNTQAALVMPGGSTMVEFTVDVPGKFLLVDHALARMNKGAWAVLEVTGEENPNIFSSVNPREN